MRPSRGKAIWVALGWRCAGVLPFVIVGLAAGAEPPVGWGAVAVLVYVGTSPAAGYQAALAAPVDARRSQALGLASIAVVAAYIVSTLLLVAADSVDRDIASLGATVAFAPFDIGLGLIGVGVGLFYRPAGSQ